MAISNGVPKCPYCGENIPIRSDKPFDGAIYADWKEHNKICKHHPLNKQNMSNDMPRRNRIDLFVSAEKAIYDAIQEVEKMAADTRLTEATILLQQAQSKVADFIDGILPKEEINSEMPNTDKPFLLSYHFSIRNDEGWGNTALVFAKSEEDATKKLIQTKTTKRNDALSSWVVKPDHIKCLNIQ